MTLRKINPTGPNSTTLELQTENLETFAGYPGHLITVTVYKPTPSDPEHAIETVLTTALFTGVDANNKSIVLNLSGIPSPIFASVRLRVDTTVPPGLYDDFVLTKLENQSANATYVATFGFSA